tara:strand:- start:192 stop:689 length:498 start_codon:yes stop_codon:yes gene_type:complete
MIRALVLGLMGVSFLSFEAVAAGIGSETGFAIPRFVSMRAEKANVRRGPTLDHRIDWVFERAGLPVVVRGEFGHWRLIEDVDGDGGWVHRALIAGRKTGLVRDESVDVYAAPFDTAGRVAEAKEGIIVNVEECTDDWCQIEWKSIEGWMKKDDLWGVDPEQIQVR